MSVTTISDALLCGAQLTMWSDDPHERNYAKIDDKFCAIRVKLATEDRYTLAYWQVDDQLQLISPESIIAFTDCGKCEMCDWTEIVQRIGEYSIPPLGWTVFRLVSGEVVVLEGQEQTMVFAPDEWSGILSQLK